MEEKFYEIKDDYIFEYIRDNKRNKIGVLLAMYNTNENQVCFGWSLCKKIDEFDKYSGIVMAIHRTYYNNNRYHNNIDRYIPKSILKYIPNFLNRVKKYYKDKEQSKLIEKLCRL
jgi:hypothetical protein